MHSYYNDENNQQQPYNFLLKESVTTNSKGETIKQEYFYPENFSGEYTALENANMLAVPVQTKSYLVDGSATTQLSNQKTEFSGTVPSAIKVAKGNLPLEERVAFERYRQGNLVQARQTDNTPTAYIWGYDRRYIVAKVENATYSDIENLPAFGQNFVITEALSTAQENALRGMPGVQVTTFTYEPLVGVKTITDARGYTSTYEYDAMHRLKRVKDEDGNVLQSYEYNYGSN